VIRTTTAFAAIAAPYAATVAVVIDVV